MQETEPIYFKEFRKELKNQFERIDKKFATKSDLELMKVDFHRHVTDLTKGFNEKVKGVCNQVDAIDEKLTRIDIRTAKMDENLTSVQREVFYIKNELNEKTDKKETLGLKRRIIRLETKNA